MPDGVRFAATVRIGRGQVLPLTSNNGFFETKKAAALFKHELLINYVVPAATMLSTRSDGNRVWFIDGYAGPGRYASEIAGEPGAIGSPVLAVKAARTLSTFDKKPRDLRCVFIESDPAHASTLRRTLAQEAPPGVAWKVMGGAIEENLDDALGAVGADPLIAFLDPFGTALEFELMCSMLLRPNSTGPSEVLLNLNVESVRRIGALLGRTELRSDADDKTLARVDAFLGGQDWRQTFLQHYRPGQAGTASAGARAVADHFRHLVERRTGFKSIWVPIRRGYESEPIFQLTLFSGSDVGLYVFADAASTAFEKWRAHFREIEMAEAVQSDQDSLFADVGLSAEYVQSKWVERERVHDATLRSEIRGNITRLVAQSDYVPVAANITEIYGAALGVAREKHLRAAWRELASANVVESIQPGTPRLRDAALVRARSSSRPPAQTP